MKTKAMEFSYRQLLEFAWKLNSTCWNTQATTVVVLFVMLIRTILIPNFDCLDGKTNALKVDHITRFNTFLLELFACMAMITKSEKQIETSP